MIRMSGEINLLESIGEIDNSSIEISPTKNNISANISDIIGVRKDGTNPFLFGISKLGSGATFSNGEDYFIGSVAADENGDFETNYVLTFNIYISSEEFNSSQNKKLNFTLVFDTYNTAYAKNIIVSWGHGYTIGILQKETVNKTNNSPFFVFNSNAEITSNGMHWVSITIQDWSMPNYPLRLQGIYTGLSIYLDKRNLISISCPMKDRSDDEQPSYGLISNTGEISVIDSTLEIKDYAHMGLLTSDLKVKIVLENTISGKKEVISNLKTEKWSYDNINREVTIELKDDIEQLQNISTDGFNLSSSQMTLWYIFIALIDQNPMLKNYHFNILDSAFEILNSITCQHPYLNKGTAWEQLTKLCNIAGLHIYEDVNHDFVINSDFII